ncbi:MAG: homoprotocatechuate degradation operon regulator, HpaR [Paracoccaceae bacterium]|nr:MAG: homoprotocatechuate degradation operon regulator HpaR [Alphaproteobacteria bacterium]GIX12339.1 MAG: homoprotocatechuate degradation operon regulator, HpaR [Paracoccaceae bacterium]
MTDPVSSRKPDPRHGPRPVAASLPIMLLRARELVMEYFRPFLADNDLTDAQWRVLRVLHEGGPMEPTEISVRGLVLTPSLTRILKTLESRGLIRRAPHPTDKRRHQIILTEDAHELIARLTPLSDAGYREIERRFGPEMTRALLALLTEFCRR